MPVFKNNDKSCQPREAREKMLFKNFQQTLPPIFIYFLKGGLKKYG